MVAEPGTGSSSPEWLLAEAGFMATPLWTDRDSIPAADRSTPCVAYALVTAMPSDV
jgi:hypothetical protein